MLKENNKNPFRLPDDYFEDFHNNIMLKIPGDNKAKSVPLWRKIVPWSAVAAVLCGAIFSISYLTSGQKSPLSKADTQTEKPMQDMYASSSYEDDYYLFIEDEILKDSYVNTFFD